MKLSVRIAFIIAAACVSMLVIAPMVLTEAHAATSCDLWVGDEEVTTDHMSGDGWWYDGTRLFLDGFNYEGPGHTTKDGKQAVIYKTGSKTLNIRVRGDSYINATGMYGIYDDSSEYGKTEISADGRPYLLSIKAPVECIKSNKAGMDLTEANIRAEAYQKYDKNNPLPDTVYGIDSAGELTIRYSNIVATARAPRKVTSPRHNQAAGIKAGQTDISLESSVEAYGYNAADNYGIYCGNYNIYLGRDLTYLLMRGETKAAECSSVLMQDDDYTVYGWTDIDGKNDTDLIDSDAGSNTAIHQKYKRISTEGDSEIVYDVSGYIGKYDGEGHSITVDIENEDPDSFDIKYSLKPDGVYEINGKYVAKFCRDVGVYTVYYRISKRGYKTVRGEEKIIIGDEYSIRDVEPFDPVVTCPERNALTFDGTEQVLLKPGTVKGGTMMYALGDDDSIAPNEGWSTVVPTGNEAGKYHVWFKVEGDVFYNSIPPVYVPVTIAGSDHEEPAERPETESGDAVSYNLWVGDEEVTSKHMSGDGWEFSGYTLYLTDFDYVGAGHETDDGRRAVIYYSGYRQLDIFLGGEAYIDASGGMYGILVDSSDAMIYGSFGNECLSIKAPLDCIKVSGTLNLDDCNIKAESYTSEESDSSYSGSVYAVNAGGTLIINGSSVTASARSPRKVPFPNTNYAAGIKAAKIYTDHCSLEAYGYNAEESYGVLCSGEIKTDTRMYSLIMAGETRAVKCYNVHNEQQLYAWNDINGEFDETVLKPSIYDGDKLGSYKRITTESSGEIKYTSSGYDGQYDEKYHTITVNTDDMSDEYNIEYSLKDDGIYEWNDGYVPKIKDAGFHTVYFRILRNGYKTVTGKEKVILRTYGSSIKRDPTVTLPVKLSLNYNGIDQSLLKAGATTSGTLKYALGTDEKTVPERGWRRTVPKGNQAGVYHVWFKVEGNDKYNSIPAMHIPVTIAESRPPYRPRPDTSVKEYEEKVSAAKAKKVKIKSFKAKKNKKKLEVKWKKLSGVSGYEIQYTASKTFTKKNTKKTLKKLTAGPKTTKKTLMKLSSKRKTYRIRIRSFTKVKNPTTGKYEKIRGKWSAIKKAKA